MYSAVVVPIKHVCQLHACWGHPSLEAHVSGCIVPCTASHMSLPLYCKSTHLHVALGIYSVSLWFVDACDKLRVV